MRCLSHRGVIHVEVAPDRAHHHLAGVHPDPDVDRHAGGTPGDLGIAFHRLLHSERRVAGPHGMVLVSEWCTEECHDAVAHHLVDGPLVAVDRFHHVFEHRVEELPGLLGIAIREELHGALEVGEQHGDLLALAFEGRLRGQDALGEVLGSVRLR